MIKNNYPQAEMLAPITFFVIIGTVIFYGIASPIVARKLGVAESGAQGLLLVGAHNWARAIAKVLIEEKFPTVF